MLRKIQVRLVATTPHLSSRIDQLAPGLNLTPVWLPGDLDLVTTQPLPSNMQTISEKEIIKRKRARERERGKKSDRKRARARERERERKRDSLFSWLVRKDNTIMGGFNLF